MPATDPVVLLALWPSGVATPLMIGAAVVLLLVATALIIWQSRPRPDQQSGSDSRVVEADAETAPIPKAAKPAAESASATQEQKKSTPKPSSKDPDDSTETDYPWAKAPVEEEKHRDIPSAEEAEKASTDGDYMKAADCWRSRGDLLRERAALLKADAPLRLAQVELALGMDNQAIPRLNDALSASPSEEKLRLRLIEALLDEDHPEDAKALADAVAPEDSPIAGNAKFIAAVARAFEAYGDLEAALQYYKIAANREQILADVPVRLMYLHQIVRLAAAPAPKPDTRTPSKFIKKALDESQASFLEDPSTNEPDRVSDDATILSEHEVIVGHLALGGGTREYRHSVRSAASVASRLALTRLVGERASSAVFEGVDQMLDCPVAVKISRVATEHPDCDVLRQRLQAISLINHPNVSKLTYADCYGGVIRVVTEYHSGGSLAMMAQRMEQIGLPLILRILLQVTSGIAAAHRHGIMHGDLRPENIMVGHDQLIKVHDFSLHPWPVRRPNPDQTPREGNPSGMQENEIQMDLSQFADVIEFLIEKAMVPHSTPERPSILADPLEELREMVKRARRGEFSSFAHAHRILAQILDRSLPRPANSFRSE
ncbi:protein kinase [bacterium]|nr:protein kinase [bacterium]